MLKQFACGVPEWLQSVVMIFILLLYICAVLADSESTLTRKVIPSY